MSFTIKRHKQRMCPSVCLSVCPSQAGIVSKRVESSWFLAWRLTPYIPSCVIRRFVYPRIRVLPSGNLSRTPDFENFATASKSRCQQNLLSPSSVVELVDDTYMTVDESWLFTTSRLTVTLLLHYFDLLWICCTVCFFDEILTEIACRAVCLQ